jgi:hypothetical protein
MLENGPFLHSLVRIHNVMLMQRKDVSFHFLHYNLIRPHLNLNSVNQLIFVMVKCGVLFEVRTEFLNTIYTCFVFKGSNLYSVNQLISVMVKCGVLFEVRTEFLNNT